MSCLLILNGALSWGAFLGYGVGKNDDFLQPPDYRTTPPQGTAFANMLRDTDILWPRSSMLGADYSNVAPVFDCAAQMWEWNFPPTGNHVPKKVSGVVRNSSGTPVAGATVWLFNTTTGLLVDTQITASDGSYSCADPNAVACFAVGYLTGSPDTAGVTVDTVTGT